MKVAISAGHWPEAAGACYERRCEYGEVMPILAEVIRHLQRQDIEAHLVGTGYLTDKIDDINALSPDCCVEINLNAAAVDAEGCESVYYPKSRKGRKLAQDIQEYLPEATGNTDRGVKEGWYWSDDERAGKLAFLSDTSCTAVIVEPFFIANEPEIMDHDWKLQKIGMAIARGIKQWSHHLNLG